MNSQTNAKPQAKAASRYDLLPFNHPTYLRRMAKELNASVCGFYYGGERWTKASVHSMPGSGGKDTTLRISRATDWNGDGDVIAEDSKTLADLSNVVFGDGNGGTITAHRAIRP